MFTGGMIWILTHGHIVEYLGICFVGRRVTYPGHVAQGIVTKMFSAKAVVGASAARADTFGGPLRCLLLLAFPFGLCWFPFGCSFAFVLSDVLFGACCWWFPFGPFVLYFGVLLIPYGFPLVSIQFSLSGVSALLGSFPLAVSFQRFDSAFLLRPLVCPRPWCY